MNWRENECTGHTALFGCYCIPAVEFHFMGLQCMSHDSGRVKAEGASSQTSLDHDGRCCEYCTKIHFILAVIAAKRSELIFEMLLLSSVSTLLVDRRP